MIRSQTTRTLRSAWAIGGLPFDGPLDTTSWPVTWFVGIARNNEQPDATLQCRSAFDASRGLLRMTAQ